MRKAYKLGLYFGPLVFVRAAVVLTLYVSQVLIARYILTPEEFGQFSLFLSVLGILVILIKAGMDTAQLKYYAIYREDDDSRLGSFLLVSVLFVFISCIVIYFVLSSETVGQILLAIGLLGGAREEFLLVASGALVALSEYRRATIAAMGSPIACELHNGFFRPVMTLLISWAILFNFDVASYLDVAGAYAISYGLAVLISLPVAYLSSFRETYENSFWVALPGLSDVQTWLSTGLRMMSNVLLRQCIRTMDILLCGVFLSTAEVALYAVASRISNLVVFGLASTNLAFAPSMAKLYASGNEIELASKVRLSSNFVFSMGCAATVFVVLFADQMLGLFGETYTEAYPALLILCAGQLLNSYFGPIGYLASMTGKERLLTIAILISIPIPIAVYLIAIPAIGISGAALGAAIGNASWNFCLYFFLQRELGISCRASSKNE